MTSAITNMSVAEVRRALSQLRKSWRQHSVVQPFCPSNVLIDDMTIADFALRFLMGHHSKRHR